MSAPQPPGGDAQERAQRLARQLLGLASQTEAERPAHQARREQQTQAIFAAYQQQKKPAR